MVIQIFVRIATQRERFIFVMEIFDDYVVFRFGTANVRIQQNDNL